MKKINHNIGVSSQLWEDVLNCTCFYYSEQQYKDILEEIYLNVIYYGQCYSETYKRLIDCFCYDKKEDEWRLGYILGRCYDKFSNVI